MVWRTIKKMTQKSQGKLVGIKFYRGRDIPEDIRESRGISVNDIVKREIREINIRVSFLDKSDGFLTKFRNVFKDKMKIVSDELIKDVQRIRLADDKTLQGYLSEYRNMLSNLNILKSKIENRIEDTIWKLSEDGYLK